MNKNNRRTKKKKNQTTCAITDPMVAETRELVGKMMSENAVAAVFLGRVAPSLQGGISKRQVAGHRLAKIQ